MRMLKVGLHGDDVKAWQAFLIKQGFLPDGEADGTFGPKTDAATRAFQAKFGLEMDGRVGQQTQAQAQQLTFVPPATGTVALMGKSEQLLQDVHPELAQRIRTMADEVASQMQCVVASGFRSFAEQDALYAIGRTTERDRKPVTNARAGQSYHNYGLAVDVHTWKGTVDWTDEAEATMRGPIGESLGLEWGGRWTSPYDPPHFQLTTGLTIGECKALHDRGGRNAVWADVSRRLSAKALFIPGEQVE